jgi:transcriptional regulator GlxA family with amidase domain
MKIQSLIFDGFDELDLFGVYEPLRMAGFEIKLISLDDQKIVESIHGVKIVPDGIINQNNRPEILIVIGGGWVARANRGAWAEAKRGKVLEVLKDFHKSNVTLAAVCTGAMLVAKAGLLTGRPAITNHQALEELEAEGAIVKQARVVDDGDIITAGGITSSIDLGIYLVEKLINKQVAAEIAVKLEFQPRY